jgi:hypothetical protein
MPSFASRRRDSLLVIKLPSVQRRQLIEEGQLPFSAESPPRLADVDDLRLGFLPAFCCHGFSLVHFTFDLVVLLGRFNFPSRLDYPWPSRRIRPYFPNVAPDTRRRRPQKAEI